MSHPSLGVVLLLLSLSTALDTGAWRRRGVTYSGGARPADGTAVAAAARALGVEAPWAAPKWVWSLAWRNHKRLLPLLHAGDAAAPENTCVNLMVLWLKALAGDDAAYALLPRGTRGAVSPPLRKFYPLLHHQNTKLRSVFLDDALKGHLDSDDDVLVVSLGAGFCTRSLRLRGSARCVEVDLPSVVAQKERLLADRGIDAPNLHFIAADLSRPADVDAALRRAVRGDDEKVVFVVEALLIYLDSAPATRLLAALAQVAPRTASLTLCFADRIPNVSGVDEADVRAVLAATGWTRLETYLPKPGLARHMGIARPS